MNMTNTASTVPQTRDNPLGFKIEKILVPLDFSPASVEALDYAVSMAKQFHAAIHLVHVYPPDEASSAGRRTSPVRVSRDDRTA